MQWAAGRKKESREAHDYGKEILRASGGNGNWARARFFSIERYIEQGEKLRLVLNHRRQADNALRLGLIDQKRYANTIERLQGKYKKNERREDAFGRYTEEIGFLRDLPTDHVVQGKRSKRTSFRSPHILKNASMRATDDQQAEYVEAFGARRLTGSRPQICKVRVTSLLRSIIVHPQFVDCPRVEAECRLLSAIHNDSKDDVYSQVADVARFLSRLAPEDRRDRLAILRQLDANSADGPAMTITLDLASGTTM